MAVQAKIRESKLFQPIGQGMAYERVDSEATSNARRAREGERELES